MTTYRIGCIAVHYGKEYLAWAVSSLALACDEVHVFYTASPSFGFVDHRAKCPDTEAELEAAARRFVDPERVIWRRVDGVTSESMHRNLMLETARGKGATLMAIADADEVWAPYALDRALYAVEKANSAGRWLAGFHNFWRSWQWTVADSFRPVRIVDLRHSLSVDAYLTDDMQPRPVYHFGYAQSLATMAYKFTCHGHKAEFRPRWWEEKFVPWTPEGPHSDLHPCVNNLWTAEPTDPETVKMLGLLLPDHPHRALDVIA